MPATQWVILRDCRYTILEPIRKNNELFPSWLDL